MTDDTPHDHTHDDHDHDHDHGERSLDPAPVVERLSEVMADGRPAGFDALLEATADLLPQDPHLAGHVLDEILMHTPHIAWVGSGDEVVDLRRVLAGRVFTHVLSVDEVAAGAIAAMPDLDLLVMPFATEVPLVGGATAAIEIDDAGDVRLAGPQGWPGAAAGTAIEARLTDTGLDVRSAGTIDEADPALVGRLAERFEALLDDGDEAVPAFLVTLAEAVASPDAWTVPTRPVGELLAAAGLEVRDAFVGRAGTGWRTPPERAREEGRLARSRVFGFDDCCHDAFDTVMNAFQSEDAARAADPAVAAALAHGAVSEAFLSEVVGRAGHHIDEVVEPLRRFAEAVLQRTRGADAAGALHILAAVHDIAGDPVAAESATREVLRVAPGHRAALELQAGWLETRGDAARAADALRRAGVRDTDPQLARLTELAALVDRDVGRNDPCPCGSGRKYKACCIDRPALAPERRVRWLYDKALGFVLDPARRAVPLHFAIHALDQEGTEESPADRVFTDPRFAEITLFEAEGLDWFLGERGALLPAGEAAMAREWSDVALWLYAVETIDDGGLVLRDVDDGEQIRVAGLAHGEPPEVGTLVTGRLLPADDRLWLAGPVCRIEPDLRDTAFDLLDADEVDPHTFAEFIGFLGRPVDAGETRGDFVPQGHAH